MGGLQQSVDPSGPDRVEEVSETVGGDEQQVTTHIGSEHRDAVHLGEKGIGPVIVHDTPDCEKNVVTHGENQHRPDTYNHVSFRIQLLTILLPIKSQTIYCKTSQIMLHISDMSHEQSIKNFQNVVH